jgi:hypothetical protein
VDSVGAEIGLDADRAGVAVAFLTPPQELARRSMTAAAISRM